MVDKNCIKCNSPLEFLAGRSAHYSNQYCPMCDVKVEEPLGLTQPSLSEQLADAKPGQAIRCSKEELVHLVTSDGSTASYYELPTSATELQHLISYKDMNAQIGEIFRACYRYGGVAHSEKLRDAKKIKFYVEAEIERLLKQEEKER